MLELVHGHGHSGHHGDHCHHYHRSEDHSKILKAPVPEISPLFAMFLIICNYPRKHTTKPFELYQVENDKQQKMPTIIQVNHTASSSNYDYDDDLDVCALFLDR